EVLGKGLGRSCQVTREESRVFNFRTVKGFFPEQVVFLSVSLDGSLGEMKFLLDPSAAAFFADLMMMGDGTAAFSAEEHLDAVREMISQILGDYTTALSSQFEKRIAVGEIRTALLDISPSDFSEDNWVWSPFKIDLEGERLLLKMTSHTIIHNLIEGPAPKDAEDVQPKEPVSRQARDADARPADSAVRDMELLLDIDLPIVIELGRTSLLIREILKLGPGSIIELDKLSGEPVDVYVNDKKFAEGEVVVIDENFGVRVTEVLRPDERLKALRD
ncbi:MAG: flagellar motor switch protein FliN, partial [Calditrichaeota bacterium]|nr:flagellar motor switch protein FliN [Calditrichota bacterium]